MEKTIKLYGLIKNRRKKISKGIREFCFDISGYFLKIMSVFSGYEGELDKYELERNHMLDKVGIIYISEGDLTNILLGEKVWIVKKEVVEVLEKGIGKKKLYKEVEFFPVELIPEGKFLDKDYDKLPTINGYYIMHVINGFDFRDFFIKGENEYEILSKYDFVRKRNPGYRSIRGDNILLFSERVKNILEKYDLGIYDIECLYEG